MKVDPKVAGEAIGHIIEKGTAKGLTSEQHGAAIMGLCSLLVMTAREAGVSIETVVDAMHRTDLAMSEVI